MHHSVLKDGRTARPASRRAIILSLIAGAFALAAPAAQAAQVWTASSATKVRPLAPVPAGAPVSAALSAARNEFESFQIVVTGPATGVSMRLEGLSDGNGHAISGRDVVLYREAIINVPAPSGGDGAAGLWPDALVPDVDPIVGEKRNAFPFDVPAGQSLAVLVDIHVPANAPAGDYSGIIVVEGGVAARVPFKVTVWDFAVPSTSTLRTAFGMAWNGPCMGHGDGSCSNYAAEMVLRQRYLQAALDNHISIDVPYYTSPLRADGTGDFNEYDRLVGPFLDGTANTRLAGAKLTAVEVEGVGITTAQDSAWSQHFRTKGWFPALFNYICDEPPMTCQWTDVTLRDNVSIAADPALPRLVTTTTAEAAANGAIGISLFTPVINFMEGRPGTGQYAGNQRSKYPATIFWYQSCMSFGCSGVGPGYDSVGNSGWPTYAIDSDLTRNRAMEWLSFSYDVQGELYYEMTMAYFTGDPWVNQTNFGGTGDGTLFYPGTPARIGGQTEIPVESLRMKAIRDGMEDYELLNLASKLGHRTEALAIARGVFPTTYQATATPVALASARAQLAAIIVAANAPPGTPGSGADAGTAADAGSAADAGTAADAGGGVVAGGGADAGTDGGIPVQGSGVGGSTATSLPSGCAGAGTDLAWLALPGIAFALLRRRKRG
jgi:hypothetical protein